VEKVLGSREVPGGTITVTAQDEIQAGASVTFRLELSGDLPVPTEARAWIGTAYDPSATGLLATPVPAEAGSYSVTMTLPSPIPGEGHVWVRLAFDDGSVIETSAEDFSLVDL
jgi:hypothetical protein